MFAAYKWSQCDTFLYHAAPIWTAGQWENPNHKSRFVWKRTDGRSRAMGYTNWDKNQHGYQQPDNSGGNEACVNLWKKDGCTWNDAACYNRYCFVCEEWGLQCSNRGHSKPSRTQLSSQPFDPTKYACVSTIWLVTDSRCWCWCCVWEIKLREHRTFLQTKPLSLDFIWNALWLNIETRLLVKYGNTHNFYSAEKWQTNKKKIKLI